MSVEPALGRLTKAASLIDEIDFVVDVDAIDVAPDQLTRGNTSST